MSAPEDASLSPVAAPPASGRGARVAASSASGRGARVAAARAPVSATRAPASTRDAEATGDAQAARCLVCRSTDAAVRYRITRFDVMECRGCAQVFLHPLPSEEEIVELFRQLYTTGEGSVPELKEYYQYTYRDEPENPLVAQYERHLELIERHHAPGRILDLGCGTGLFLAVARRRGWEPFGVDESREATDWARDHFGLDPWVQTFESFAGAGHSFDVITGWDVIEHSRDPVALLDVARTCLAPGGIVALSTPNQRSILDLVAGLAYRLSGGAVTAPLEKFYIEQHFLYFTPDTMRACLERAGLEVVRMERELTDLRRLTMSPVVRLGLHALFGLARLTGRENRLFLVARPKDRAPGPPGAVSPGAGEGPVGGT